MYHLHVTQRVLSQLIMKNLTLWGIYMPVGFFVAGPVGCALVWLTVTIFRK